MSHMKKMIARCLTVLTAVLVAAGMGIPAYAASDGVSVGISVSQTFRDYSTAKADDTFSYVLTPLDKGIPMPGASSTRYSFTMKGTETVTLPDITFTRTGLYRYSVKQTVGREKKGYTYDYQVYRVEVDVTNAKDGGLEASVVVYKESGEKTGKISFANSYRKPSDKPDKPPKTGDSNRPWLWFSLLVLSAFGVAMVLVLRKRDSRKSRDPSLEDQDT